MRNVSYFSPYKSGENIVTNSVLLLLSHVNRIAPDLFELFLQEVGGEDITVGPTFGNQEGKQGGKSIVDAVIRQSSIEINIETKIVKGSSLDMGQLERHAEGMKLENRSTRRVLLGITPDPMSNETAAVAKKICDANKVTFSHMTFLGIVDFFEEATSEFRQGLNTVLNDFLVYLSNNKLLPPSQNRMLINPCGQSLQSNRDSGIYHDQPYRSKVMSKYLGCYDDKAVRLVGEVYAVVIAEIDNEKLVIHEQFDLPWQKKSQKITDADKQRILNLIQNSPYSDLGSNPSRYYLTHGFQETEYRKTSKGGIQGHRYFALDGKGGVLETLFENSSEQPSLSDIVSALKKETWT